MKTADRMKREIVEKYNSAEYMFTCYSNTLAYEYNATDAIAAARHLGVMMCCVELMIKLFNDYSLRDRYSVIDRRIHESEFE